MNKEQQLKEIIISKFDKFKKHEQEYLFGKYKKLEKFTFYCNWGSGYNSYRMEINKFQETNEFSLKELEKLLIEIVIMEN